MNRRHFLHSVSGSVAALAAGALVPAAAPPALARAPRAGEAVDRRARVARHHPVVRALDPWAPLTVGNGGFAFTADVTGLQSYPESYGVLPLATQAEWGWHSFPDPHGYRLEDALVPWDAHGRPVLYDSAEKTPAGQWLRQNPHRLSLARIGFELRRADGRRAEARELTAIHQELELWSGTLASRFELDGHPVRVWTWAHPELDLVAVRVEAPELPAGHLAMRIAFPYASAVHTGDPADWSHRERHRTVAEAESRGSVRWRRELDADRYWARAAWAGPAGLRQESEHSFLLEPAARAGRLELAVAFSPDSQTAELPAVEEVRRASERHWQAFWQDGGVLDLAGSRDARARELERRIVLSEYLTAVNCSGSLPPQETGLTFDSWYGKFHLEMHWWHAAHFALWDRAPLLARSLPWYVATLPAARAIARRQGYAGARWPKMVGPDGRDSPSGIGAFLIWQQPHPIYLAELVYRARPRGDERALLERMHEVVFETADFMASYPWWNAQTGRFVLGPPLIPAQEIHPARTTFDPTFELAYWAFGLETAQRWRERLGLPREPSWERVSRTLSDLPMRDGLYTNAASDLETWRDARMRRDHPSLLGAYGFIASPRVDREAMRRTLHRVLSDWQWDDTWGWDYPLVAMAAARLGEPDAAVDALLMDTPKNRYLPNGHNYQRPGLSIYLPGNGGLLAAMAMMAVGWDGATAATPGFPQSGWQVRWERLRGLP